MPFLALQYRHPQLLSAGRTVVGASFSAAFRKAAKVSCAADARSSASDLVWFGSPCGGVHSHLRSVSYLR